MINIPQLVRVGSVDYEVGIKEGPIVADGLQLLGECDYIYHKISLDKNAQDRQGLEITFLHELVHAMLFDKKINLEAYGATYEQMEHIVDSLAYALHQVIRDNQDMFIDLESYEDIDFNE